MQEMLTFDDVLLVPNYNDIPSRKDVNTAVCLWIGELCLKIPIISSNMDTITEHKMANVMESLGGWSILHRFMSIEQNVEEFNKCKTAGVSVGVGIDGQNRAAALYEAGARFFCVDVAHGHSKAVGQMIKNLRSNFHATYVIAGNVATHAGADYLASCGADAIKVGIGPGSVCSTRIKTGFGVPQLSAIMECSRVDRTIIADGGIRNPGDAVKSLAAGADLIMLGGMLAGTDETPGEIITDKQYICGYPSGYEAELGKYKLFRGMASKEAQDDFMGSMAEWKTAEGVEIRVPCRGPVKTVIQDLMGGIRSGMTYCGARTIEELQRRANFVRITAAGYAESVPHGKNY